MGKILKKILSASLSVVILSALVTSASPSVYADSTRKYCYTVASWAETSKKSSRYSSFLIDFKTDRVYANSYLEVCQSNLDISEIKKEYPNAQGGLFYGGYQYTVNGNNTLFSFWDITDGPGRDDRDNVITTPIKVYPEGAQHSFGGEGNGNNYAGTYNWKANTWYTTLVRCWQDKETGKTFIGQWVKDNDTGKWQLMTYFNTTMSYTYMVGNVAQFLENFGGGPLDYSERDMYIKNIYCYDIDKDDWQSINSIKWQYYKYSKYEGTGKHEVSVKDNSFYMVTGGSVANQAEYDSSIKQYNNPLSLVQPSKPTFDDFILDTVSIVGNKLTWETDVDSSPMASYCIDVINESDMIVKTYRGNRPEKTSITTDSSFKDGKYRIRLSFKDVFNNSQSYNYAVNIKNGKAEVSQKDILVGDVDSNGSIGLSDIVALMRGTISSSKATAYQRKVGDINGDNTISLKDAVLLQKWLLGVEGNYNIGDKIEIESEVEATELQTDLPTQKPTEKPTQAPTTVSSTQKVQFTNAQNWSNVYVYAWNSQTLKANASWPGVQMKYESTNSMGQSIYALDISKNFDRVIFTTASGSPQTQDVVWNNTVQQGYWVTSKTTTNSYGAIVYIVQPWGKDENGNNV